jgi:hypothetical protein
MADSILKLNYFMIGDEDSELIHRLVSFILVMSITAFTYYVMNEVQPQSNEVGIRS